MGALGNGGVSHVKKSQLQASLGGGGSKCNGGEQPHLKRWFVVGKGQIHGSEDKTRGGASVILLFKREKSKHVFVFVFSEITKKFFHVMSFGRL